MRKRLLYVHEHLHNNSLDGVYTHGVNRFPRFLQNIKDGHIIVNNEPVLTGGFGAVEQWNGQSGPGILNAIFCTERATNIAEQNGIGCVAISHTNHWMRGGTYGWKAAKKVLHLSAGQIQLPTCLHGAQRIAG
ncbi:MAG: Ldh family oxidoreductase [Chitinophagaceae bacterium]